MIENYATTGIEAVLVWNKIGTLILVALFSENNTEAASTNDRIGYLEDDQWMSITSTTTYILSCWSIHNCKITRITEQELVYEWKYTTSGCVKLHLSKIFIYSYSSLVLKPTCLYPQIVKKTLSGSMPVIGLFSLFCSLIG